MEWQAATRINESGRQGLPGQLKEQNQVQGAWVIPPRLHHSVAGKGYQKPKHTHHASGGINGEQSRLREGSGAGRVLPQVQWSGRSHSDGDIPAEA